MKTSDLSQRFSLLAVRKGFNFRVLLAVLVMMSTLSVSAQNRRNVRSKRPVRTTQRAVSKPVAVDLGLPSGTKWADRNIGASSPSGYGGYYQWGETKTASFDDIALNLFGECYNSVVNAENEWREQYIYYDYDSCEDNDSAGLGGKEINLDPNYEHYESVDIAGTQYDVAHVKWGNNWRMPTNDDIEELVENCSTEWTSLNGVKGCKFIGPNGNSIFLPAAGYAWGAEYLMGQGLGYGRGYGHKGRGSLGYYWTSTNLNPERRLTALKINHSGACSESDIPVGALPIRPVQSE